MNTYIVTKAAKTALKYGAKGVKLVAPYAKALGKESVKLVKDAYKLARPIIVANVSDMIVNTIKGGEVEDEIKTEKL